MIQNNMDTKLFEESHRESAPINSIKLSSRSYKSNILNSLAQQSVFKKLRFDQQKRDIYVTQFMTNIQRGSQTIKKLNELQLQMINDQASSQQPQQIKKLALYKINSVQKQFLENFKQTLNRNLDKLPLLTPGSRLKFLWDAASVMARLYFCFVIPLDLGWKDKSFLFYDCKGISIFALLIIIFDLILSLNTAYYKDGQLVTNRLQILRHSLFNTYGLQWFTVFMMILFFFISISEEALFQLKDTFSYQALILFLVHFKPIIISVNYYEENLNLNKKIQSSLELCKLLFVLFYSIHIFSCLWMLVGNYSSQTYNKSWLIQSQVQDADWSIQYLQAFYYSAVTMFTIGYGDVTPQSYAEKVLAVIYIIAASIQLPYSVNTLGTVIQQISAYTEEKKRKLRIINSYFNQQKISQDLQIQVREYLTYLWENQLDSKSDEIDEIISQLSSELRDSLITESYQQILNKCTLFKLGFCNNFRTNLVKFAKEIVLTPEQDLNVSDEQDINLYYILSGQLQIHHNNGMNLGILISGQSIGLANFIKGAQTLEKYKSIGFTKLICIEKKQFLKLLNEYPEDYEKYCQIRDSLQFQQNAAELLPSKCFSCQRLTHTILECPLIHYVPDREKVIKSLVYPQQQRRNPYKRGHRFLDFLTKRQVLNELRRASQQIQMENPEILQLYQAEYTIENSNPQDSNQQTLNDIANLQDSKIEYTPSPQISHVELPKVHKFKRAVNKVILINNEFSQYMRVTSQDIKKSQELLQQTMKLRFKVLGQLSSEIFKKEKDLIYSIIQKHEMNNPFDKISFEIAVNYKHYYPSGNFNNLQNSLRKRNIDLLNKLLLYFFFPCKVIDQYSLHSSDIKGKLNQRRKNMYFSVDQALQ